MDVNVSIVKSSLIRYSCKKRVVGWNCVKTRNYIILNNPSSVFVIKSHITNLKAKTREIEMPMFRIKKINYAITTFTAV